MAMATECVTLPRCSASGPSTSWCWQSSILIAIRCIWATEPCFTLETCVYRQGSSSTCPMWSRRVCVVWIGCVCLSSLVFSFLFVLPSLSCFFLCCFVSSYVALFLIVGSLVPNFERVNDMCRLRSFETSTWPN